MSDTMIQAFNDGLKFRALYHKIEGYEDEIRILREEIAKCRKAIPRNDWPHTTDESKAYIAGFDGKRMPQV